MKRSHSALLALFFLAALLASGYAMSGRAAAYNASQDKKLWAFKDVNLRRFSYAGREVGLTDSASEDGDTIVTLRYGDRELKLSSSIKPGDPALPELIRHADWLKVLRFAEYGTRTYEEFQAHLDEGNDRIAVVVKRPLTSADPRTGDVWDKDWAFDFHELRPDGSIDTEGLRLPKTRGNKAPKANELKPGTWEMEAALHLMPKTPPDSLSIGRPTAAFRNDAMKALGWTMPVATISACGFILFAALAAAPRRKRAISPPT